MKNKTILITGATAGIGKATAIGLAKKGATIVFNSRNVERGEKARSEIISASGNQEVFVLPCDLSSLESIKTFASQFLDQFKRLDVLINNAGVWETSRSLTEDGFEKTFGVNHLAPFYLTGLLLNRIKESAPARIVNVSSMLHTKGEIDFDDLQMEQNFSGMQAYNNSKLMNILFTRHLAAKLSQTGVTVNCLHPGFISTELARNTNFFAKMFVKIAAKKVTTGAETSIYLASTPEVANVTGEYFDKMKIARSAGRSKDMEKAEQLWKVSESMCNLSYP